METVIITKLSYYDGYTLEGHDLIRFFLDVDSDEWDDDMVFTGADRNLYTPEDLVGKKIQIITEFFYEY